MHPHSSAHIGRKINHSLHFSRSILQHHELGPCARPRGTQFLLSVARKIAQIRECCGARLPTPVPPSHSSSLADSVVVVLAAGDESRFGIQQVAVMPLPFSFSRYLSLFLSFFLLLFLPVLLVPISARRGRRSCYFSSLRVLFFLVARFDRRATHDRSLISSSALRLRGCTYIDVDASLTRFAERNVLSHGCRRDRKEQKYTWRCYLQAPRVHSEKYNRLP